MENSFQFVAGSVALDFVNTLDFRYDPKRRIELLPDFDSFLKFTNQAGIITNQQVQELRTNTSAVERVRAIGRIIEFREALYFLLLSVVQRKRPSSAHLLTYNRILPSVCVSHSLRWQKQEFILSPGKHTNSPCAPLQPIMESANQLLTSADRRYIGECSDKWCRWLFLDRSKNHSRRWCSMEICGNRSKARTFYSLVRSGGRPRKQR